MPARVLPVAQVSSKNLSVFTYSFSNATRSSEVTYLKCVFGELVFWVLLG